MGAVCQAGDVHVDPSARGEHALHSRPVDPRVIDDSQLARLAGSRFAEVLQLPETTSTNLVLLGRALEGAPEGLVVVADYQSAGRGRFDRRWESPPGTSLLFSVLLRPSDRDLPAPRRHLALSAMALAVKEAAWTVATTHVEVKWPNDLIADDRKLAGILAEAGAEGVLVVGAGVNVAWAPEGPAATHLSALSGRTIERGELLVESLLALERLYGRWGVVSQQYKQACCTVGREVIVELGGDVPPLRGRAVDVDDDGHLVVRDTRGGLVTVAAGDVTHLHAGHAPSLSQQ